MMVENGSSSRMRRISSTGMSAAPVTATRSDDRSNAVAARVVEDRLVQRRRTGEHRDRLGVDGAQHVIDVEHRLRVDRRAPHERRQAPRLVAEHVEERVHDQVAVAASTARPCRTSRRTAAASARASPARPSGAPVVPDVNSTSQRSSPPSAADARVDRAGVDRARPACTNDVERVVDPRVAVEPDDDAQVRATPTRSPASVAA